MKDLTQGNEAKHILVFALPMFFGNLLQTLYNTVDSMWVGRGLGRDALAAVTVSFPIMFMLIALIMGITMGSTILIAQYFGAKDMLNVKKIINNTLFFLLVTSFFVTILGLCFSKLILVWITTPREILDQAVSYLNIMFGGIIFTFGYNGISAILRGMGDSKTPLYFLVISTILNIILDPVFIFSFDMGVRGAAYATIISQAVSFIASIVYLNKKHAVFKVKIKDIKPSKGTLLSIVKIGLPMGVQQTLISFASVTLNAIINGFGANAVAAFGASSRIDSFMSMPAMSLSASASTFTGQNLGAKLENRVKKGFKAVVLITSLVTVIISAIVVIFSSRLISIFSTSNLVIDIGKSYLRVVSIFYTAFAIMLASNGVIRGSGDSVPTVAFTLTGLWIVRIPLAKYLSSTRLGLEGVWWAMGIGWIAGMLVSLIYYFSGRWKRAYRDSSSPPPSGTSLEQDE